MRVCFAPSELVDQHVARSFGAVAESIIGADYLRNEVKRTSVFPFGQKDFMDFSVGFGNSTLYAAFLKFHHPKLSVSQLVFEVTAGLIKIPDLMTHDPPKRLEYYEIKPDSPSGRSAGRTKIANIDAFLHKHSLPYVPGIKYSPRKRIRLFSGRALGVDVRLFLEFKRISPGLVVYKVCVEGADVVPVAVLLAAAAVILIIITRGRILRGAPKLGPLPIPVPI